MSKKERTPKATRARFIFALAVITFMIIFILISKLTQKKETVQQNTDVEQVMDNQLDSLIKVYFPGEKTEIINKSIAELINKSEEIDRLRNLEGRLQTARELGNTNDKTYKAMYREYQELQKKLQNSINHDEYYYRSIRLKDRNSQETWTFFQKTDKSLRSSSIVTRFKISDDMKAKIDSVTSTFNVTQEELIENKQ